MGFRAEKERKEKIRKRIAVILLAVFLFFVAVMTVFCAFVPIDSWKYYFSLPDLLPRGDGELRVHFLDVGQADCTLVEFPDGQTLLIDGGDVDADEEILRYLNALKIDRLDYLLLTHTDADHCGSLAKVLTFKEIGKVFLPFVTEKELATETFLEFSEVLEKSSAQTEVVSRYAGIESTDGRYPFTFRVLFPYSMESGGNDGLEGNELSTVSWLDYCGVSTLFCGDTNKYILSNLIAEDSLGVFSDYGIDLKSTEIFKIPHHGGELGIDESVLEYFGAETAIISCGRNNYYGHPHAATLAALSALNIDAYRTDWRGNILLTVRADGSKTVSCQK